MPNDRIRIGSSQENRNNLLSLRKDSPGRDWLERIQREILKDIVNSEGSFQDVWLKSVKEHPIPAAAIRDGLDKDVARSHLEYIWNEVKRQLNERGGV